MNILFACDSLRTLYGGIRLYMRELVGALAHTPGVRVTLLAETPRHVADYPPNLPRVYLGRECPFPLDAARAATLGPRMLAGFDIFHVPVHICPMMLSRAVTCRSQARVVVTVHDLIQAIFPDYRYPAMDAYHAYWLPRAFRNTAAFVADSEHTKSDMLAHWKLPADKVHVAYLGLKSGFPVEPPVYDKAPTFVAVSSVEPRKNFERTVRGFVRFARANLGWAGKLAIVGRTQLATPELKQLAAQNAGRVELLGEVSDAELRHLYRTASGLLYLSLYEGFGLPVLEAMALGCPVLTARNSSIPEVGGDAVEYVDPTDEGAIAGGIARLASDPVLRRSLIDRGTARAARFTWAKCAADTVRVYEAALAGH